MMIKSLRVKPIFLVLNKYIYAIFMAFIVNWVIWLGL